MARSVSLSFISVPDGRLERGGADRRLRNLTTFACWMREEGRLCICAMHPAVATAGASNVIVLIFDQASDRANLLRDDADAAAAQ